MVSIAGSNGNLTLTPTDLNVILVLVVWELIWKGIALWKCGRNNQKGWFILLLIVNTVGILEIVYIFFLQPKDQKKVEEKD
jgi:hypothetical protein